MFYAIKFNFFGRPRSAVLGGFLFAAVLALLPASTEAQCKQWNVSGQWSVDHLTGDGFVTRSEMDLEQTGVELTGKLTTYLYVPDGSGSFKRSGEGHVAGIIDAGTMDGDDFYALVRWLARAGHRIYRGKIGPSGKIEGTTYEDLSPKVKETWSSPTAMKCADATVAVAPVRAKLVPPFITAARPQGRPPRTRLTWDGGEDHPYAEIWVKVDDEEEKFVEEKGKGGRTVSVEPGKTYLYILTDAGKRLATVTVRFQ